MLLTLLRHGKFPATLTGRKKLGWNCRCYICSKPITGSRPFLLLAVDKPTLLGLSHDACGYDGSRYGQYPLTPPESLSGEEVSFLVQFYPQLFSLPGWDQPKAELRRCLASLLLKYPGSIRDPLSSLREFQRGREPRWPEYPGDLEEDYFRFLGQVWEAVRENPQEAEIDLEQREIRMKKPGLENSRPGF